MKRYLIFTIVSLLTACNSSEKTDSVSNDSLLIGTWVTQACEQGIDTTGELTNLWANGEYEFTEDGLMKFNPIRYEDSQCIVKSSQAFVPAEPLAYYYEDSEKVTLQEGIKGYSLTIAIPILNNEDFIANGFYTINGGVLCFSDSFEFEPRANGFAEEGIEDINFERCLIKNNS